MTLGDVTIYSTYLYVHHRVAEAGYPVEIVNGIPSFCAVAARLNMGLVEKSEMLHIIPASYQIEEALKLPGTKVLMKAGKQMGHVKELLKQADATAVMIENCGMPGEKIYSTIDEIPEDAGYYSLIIVKEKRNYDTFCRGRLRGERSDYRPGTAAAWRSGYYYLCRIPSQSGVAG